MDSQTHLGLELLAAALVLGLLGNTMLYAAPWGLGAALWTLALAATAYGLTRRWHASTLGTACWLLLPLVGLALLYVSRDAALLKLADGVAVAAAMAFGVQRRQAAARLPETSEPPGLLTTSAGALVRWPRFLVRGIEWRTVAAEGRGQRAAAVTRGLLLAAPVLLVFGVLLAASDALFEQLVAGLLDVELARWPGHVLRTVLLAWVVGGFLLGLLVVHRRGAGETEEAEEPGRLALGVVEVGVVLGLLNALLAVFVLTQLAYFFGGHRLVLETADLTVADYARRGFFELVLVAALALPLMLGLRRLLRVRAGRDVRIFNGLAGLQVGLLVLVLASAAQRMWLYQDLFGLTELRLYASAFLGWLAVVLVWFGASVLQDQAARFVPGVVAAGFVLVVGLHAVNPEAVIVRVNAARAAEGQPFDPTYLLARSADAVPALLHVLPTLPADHRAEVAFGLLDRWHDPTAEDWRTWNRARRTARRAVHAEAGRLHGILADAEDFRPGQVWESAAHSPSR